MNAPSPLTLAGRIPPAPVLAILSRYKREDIEAFIAVAIDLLDLADGDPDLEPNGDQEGACDEDEISTSIGKARSIGGPGCSIADPDESVDDGREDDSSNDLEGVCC